MVAAAAGYGELEFRGYIDNCAEACEAGDWAASLRYESGNSDLV
jgi:hypothetical protein